jgi:hypothetical protein
MKKRAVIYLPYMGLFIAVALFSAKALYANIIATIGVHYCYYSAAAPPPAYYLGAEWDNPSVPGCGFTMSTSFNASTYQDGCSANHRCASGHTAHSSFQDCTNTTVELSDDCVRIPGVTIPFQHSEYHS